MYVISGGGYGGNSSGDGLSNGCSTIGISKTTPVEVMEQFYPVLFEEYSLHEGSGGSGKQRGGFGVNYKIKLRRGTAKISMVMDHGRFGPQGVLGGSDGGVNQVHVERNAETYIPPHLSKDQNIQKLLADANLDQNLICAIISRTVYPWIGDIVTNTEKLIQDYFSKSEIKDNKERQKHFRDLGHFLSISDRIGGYSLGDFQKAMEMAKMNAHSSSWHPAFIVRRSVVFFEDMLNNEPDMCQRVLNGLPKHMRKNFLDNIVGFMKLRQEEIQIYNQFVYDGLPLVPCIQKSTLSDDVLDELLAIYRELPKPLQFTRDDFIESISDPETILNMLRIGDSNGRIIGFAKGGPLEKYNFDLDFEDRNRGKNNTVFLEPVAIKNGYWGFHGGRELRQLFMMQVQSKGYKFMTSFAMRDVIDERKENDKNVVFVKKFDPERWDYFRVTL